MANRKKVVTSAIIVSPPQEMLSSIQAIRSKHDKSYVRWMPHINLIYPFVPATEFANIVGPLTQGLSSLQPFNLTFDSFDFFEHGARSCTLFLKPRTDPPSAVQALQSAIQKLFPFCDDLTTRSDDGLFHAHLTVGQFKGRQEVQKFKSMFEKDWKPIQFQVKEVYIISRSGDQPFSIKHTIPLGQSLQPVQQPRNRPVQRKPLSLSSEHAPSSTSAPVVASFPSFEPLPETKTYGRKPAGGGKGLKPKPNAGSPAKDLSLREDFEIRSTISVEISDSFELPKFELKKPLTTKRFPSVKERLAQQKLEKDSQAESSSLWGSSSSSFGWDDDREKEDQRLREEEEQRAAEESREKEHSSVPGERPTGPLGIVLEKAEQWITARNNREHLPKNKAKLRSSIKPMCQVRMVGLDPQEAIEKLKQEGYIQVASDAEKTVKYLRTKEQERSHYRSGQDSAPRDPAAEALQRCKSWVVEPLNRPKTLDALQNCMKQLCHVKYEFDPEKVVKLLEEQRVISIDLNDRVHYLQ